MAPIVPQVRMEVPRLYLETRRLEAENVLISII